MLLTLQRKPQDPHSTPGLLSIDGIFESYTLEPPPTGEFPRIAAGGPSEVTLRPSPKFQAIAQRNPWFKQYCDVMPHIEYRQGSVTMIHPLNKPDQTHDCVGVGQSRGTDKLINSDAAFAELHQKISLAILGEGCKIQILDCPNDSEAVRDTAIGENQ